MQMIIKYQRRGLRMRKRVEIHRVEGDDKILVKVDSKKVAHVPMAQVIRMLSSTIKDIVSQEAPTDKHGKKPEPKDEEVKEPAKT